MYDFPNVFFVLTLNVIYAYVEVNYIKKSNRLTNILYYIIDP